MWRSLALFGSIRKSESRWPVVNANIWSHLFIYYKALKRKDRNNAVVDAIRPTIDMNFDLTDAKCVTDVSFSSFGTDSARGQSVQTLESKLGRGERITADPGSHCQCRQHLHSHWQWSKVVKVTAMLTEEHRSRHQSSRLLLPVWPGLRLCRWCHWEPNHRRHATM